MMVGAILTQNTAWTNVERAIDQLRQRHWLCPRKMLQIPEGELANVVRSAGFLNQKAARLHRLCRFLTAGEEEPLNSLSTPDLRNRLLAINGIGPETADAILLYAYGRPVFVVDSYTRRIFSRLGLLSGKSDYESVRRQFEAELDADAAIFNEYHALIVAHAKQCCRSKPLCSQCFLENACGRFLE